MSKGLLISFEGGEGGGKTTQIVRLRDQLTKAGKDVVVLREPGGTAVGEQIREVVLSTKNTGISFTTEVLLFQAARAQIYREVVLPSLEAGKIVLMDRTRDSSVVYQGMVRGFGVELIDQLNNISTNSTYPDLTLLLDVPVEQGLERQAKLAATIASRWRRLSFITKFVLRILNSPKKDAQKRWCVIDASKMLEEVSASIWQEVQAKLGLK